MSNDSDLYEEISKHQIVKWIYLHNDSDLNVDLGIQFLPEFELLVNGSKMKVWEILVASKIITLDDLNKKLVSQSRIEKSTWIKPRILDLVYWNEFDEKIDFLVTNHRELLLWEKLIKAWIIDTKILFSILLAQKKSPNLLFWEILLKHTGYNHNVIKFLENCGYLTYEELEVQEVNTHAF